MLPIEARELSPATQYAERFAPVIAKRVIFNQELDTQSEYEGLRQNPALLGQVKALHPAIVLEDRLVAVQGLEESAKADPNIKVLITPAIVRLLDDGEPARIRTENQLLKRQLL